LIVNLGLQAMVSTTIKSGVKGYKIPSSNMEPSLMVGDYFYADMKYFKENKPKRYGIIVFQYPKDPSKEFIERVIGLGGEKVEMVKNKIYINDQRINDPWGHYVDDITMGGVTFPSPTGNFGPVVVPKDSLFLLGDNRDNSNDSRFWGFVSTDKIRGKPLYIYWARDKRRIGTEIRPMAAGVLQKSTLEIERGVGASSEAKDLLTTTKNSEQWKDLIPGTWEARGQKDNEPFVLTWKIMADGTFTGEESDVVGKRQVKWMFSGDWKLSGNTLISTYKWSSNPVPKPGTEDIDQIIELSQSSLVLREEGGLITTYRRR